MQTIHASVHRERGRDRPRWMEELRDHSHVWIRPAHREDAATERVFIKALWPPARRDRFLGQVRYPGQALIEQLTDLDYVHDVAFAAVVPDPLGEMFVAVARYSTTSNDTECECAVSVLDDWQHRGLGTALMRHLVDMAKIRGIKRMWSVDSVENSAMADLARRLGFKRNVDPEDTSQVIHTLWIGAKS